MNCAKAWIASRLVSRRGWSIALLVAAGLALLPKLVSADSPYSTISPASPQGNRIQDLYKLTFWLSLAVFVFIQIAIVYTSLRYRRRSDSDERPEQIHGNQILEITWTIIPAIVLLVIFIPSVREIYAAQDDFDNPDMVVEVYGKQWWWEVHYKEPDSVANVVTANEIHLPQGKTVEFKLYSNNVIHSFWVPRLHGKMDVMPGHDNRLAITTENVGYYFGQCAEFCGDSHALMRFKIIIQPEDEFNDWVAGWNAGPTSASAEFVKDGDVSQVPSAFGLCLACHRINGTNATFAPEGIDEAAFTDDGGPGAARTAGPNLSLLGCRTTIGAGALPNTPENLTKWIHDPLSIKPGNYMSTVVKEGTVSDEDIQTLVGYLESLQPEGGCGELPVEPGVEHQVLPSNP